MNNRSQILAIAVVATYNSRFSAKVKREVEEIENRVRECRGRISNDKVDEEMIPWVPDTGFSRRRNNKFLKTVDMHWHVKIFIAISIEVRGT
jgi:hypothetical protein